MREQATSFWLHQSEQTHGIHFVFFWTINDTLETSYKFVNRDFTIASLRNSLFNIESISFVSYCWRQRITHVTWTCSNPETCQIRNVQTFVFRTRRYRPLDTRQHAKVSVTDFDEIWYINVVFEKIFDTFFFSSAIVHVEGVLSIFQIEEKCLHFAIYCSV